MFEKIFPSRQARETKREIAIRRALAEHRRQIKNLQKHERQYMEKALRAKKAGDTVNLSDLCGLVAQTMNQRRAIESQLLRFETILQTRDKARLFKEFASGIGALSKSISDAVREVNAEEVMANVQQALAQSTQLESSMEMVMDAISASDIAAHSANGVTSADIERIISDQAVAEESSGGADQEIDAGLKAIEQALSGER